MAVRSRQLRAELCETPPGRALCDRVCPFGWKLLGGARYFGVAGCEALQLVFLNCVCGASLLLPSLIFLRHRAPASSWHCVLVGCGAVYCFGQLLTLGGCSDAQPIDLDLVQLENGHTPKRLLESMSALQLRPKAKPKRKGNAEKLEDESLQVLTAEAAAESEWEVAQGTAPAGTGTRFVVQLLGGSSVESVPHRG